MDKKKLQILENKILDLIGEFEDETGLSIEGINRDMLRNLKGQHKTINVNIKIWDKKI